MKNARSLLLLMLSMMIVIPLFLSGCSGGDSSTPASFNGDTGGAEEQSADLASPVRGSAVVLTGISPASGPVGTSVTLTGTGLGAPGTVKFGTTAATVTSWISTRIVARVPSLSYGAYTVTVAPRLGTALTISFTVASATDPTLTGISPASGPVGTSVTLTGTNLGASGNVTIGGTPVTSSWSSTSIVFTVPSFSPGPYTVSATPSGGSALTTSFTVTSATDPALNGISPSAGPVGTSVTLTGSNLGTSGTVKFGATTVASSWSPASIVFTVPGASAGSYTVSATPSGGTALTTSFTVTSSTATALTGISPASGPVGTSVTLTGVNLGTSGTVKFGATGAQVTSWSPTSIVTTVPALSVGACTVTVTTKSRTSATITFTVSSGLTGISPALGTVGASVTITGTGLGTSGTVAFGGTPATPSSWSPTSIVTTVPAGLSSSASYIVSVTPSGGTTLTTSFTIPKIYALFVGINHFLYVGPDLQFCVSDAEGLRDSLASSTLWNGATIVTLEDYEATKSAIHSQITTFAGQVTANDIFIFYDSGHGTNDASSSYFVPTDATTVDTCISDSEMKNWLSGLPSNAKKIAILDTCFSGGFIDRDSSKTARFIRLPGTTPAASIDTMPRHLQTVPSLVFLAACKGSEYSYESASINHGYFTYYLISGLGSGATIGPADSNANHCITAQEIFTYASSRTVTLSSGQQHPQLYDGSAGLPLKQ
jgi:hypothetical protein